MEAFILLLTFVVSALAADNCSITPIYVDFHDRCVDNCFTVQYGLFIGFGTPSQNESLWPSISHNETTIASVDYCADGSSSTCVNQTHGFYSPQLSTSYQSLTNYTSLDASSAITQDLASVEQSGRDAINIHTHYFDPSPPDITRLENYPLTILSNYSSPASPWFGPGGLLGLGPSSTILTLLHDANLISSRSFGLYVGTAYPRAGGAINGSLTLGGYDSGRFTGDAVKYDLAEPVADATDPSPYRVEVASISLTDFENNNATTVLSSGAFDAYLTTSQYELTLPEDITNQFVDLTSATAADSTLAEQSGNNITPLVLPFSFAGSLTITLSSGINITLDTTSGTLRNASNLTPLTAPSNPTTSVSPSVPMLGTSLLAHLYLTTTYDSTPPSFHLAPASPHGKYVITQPLCPNDTPEAYVSPRISSFQRNGIIGAIIGGVIGGIGLTFASFWVWRKWMQKRAGRQWEDESEEGNGRGYEVDEEGLKVPIFRGGAGAGGVGKRARLTSILKPSSSKQREGRKRTRKLDKGKDPISAYRAERNLATPIPNKSLSSSGSDDDGEMYDMSQLQGALPPHSHGYSHSLDTPQEQGRGAWPLAYPQGQSSPRQQQGGYSLSRSQEALVQDHSRGGSRSRSPSPVFSPDEHINTNIPSHLKQSSQRATPPPQSVSSPRSGPNDSENFYARIPLTPNAPLPLLANTNTNDNDRLRPLTPGSASTHARSHSEERRRELNLTVNTYFDAPPSTIGRVGKKIKLDSGKSKIKEVTQKARHVPRTTEEDSRSGNAMATSKGSDALSTASESM